MFEIKIFFKELISVHNFHQEITKIACDIDLVATTSRYCVDAKSLLGIFSMDLSHPVIVRAYTNDQAIIQKIKDIVSKEKIQCV